MPLKVWIAGASTVLGRAFIETAPKDFEIFSEPSDSSILSQQDYQKKIEEAAPDWILALGGITGGIEFNRQHPADLALDNLQEISKIFSAAHAAGVKNLIYGASSCLYPRDLSGVMSPDQVGTGPLEKTSGAFASARMAGLELCRAFRAQYGVNYMTVIPSDLYGPGLDYSYEKSHVVGALIRKFHEAKITGQKSVTLWGSGRPKRDFLFSQDGARALLTIIHNPLDSEVVNIGLGRETSIRHLAEAIREIVGFRGEIQWDTAKLDGAPSKILDISEMKKIGWTPDTSLSEGLRKTYQDFLESLKAADSNARSFSKPRAESHYRSILRIRRFEEAVAKIYPTDQIQSPIHLSIGQEAVSVGVCDHLDADDVVFGTYRAHALYLAKGGDLDALMAELYGKETGCAGGQGGSMHLVDLKAGVMGSSAIVSSLIPEAVGYAYGLKLQNKKGMVVCFFGDGAVEEGVFHESLNFAALKKLPILFVCENNGYAVHSPIKTRQSLKAIHESACLYGIPSQKIEGQKAFEVSEAAADAVRHVRSGEGPYFLECLTYRYYEHVGPNEDFKAGYRISGEGEAWKNRDPLILAAENISEEFRQQCEVDIAQEIQSSIEKAEKADFPEPESLKKNIFASSKLLESEVLDQAETGREISYAQALLEATTQQMEEDPSVIVMGIGVDDFKGTYGTTLGLKERFGSDRVFDTPLAEEGMTGIAIGAALAGMRPIHVHIRMDFLLLAMNQIVNMAAKISSMSDRKCSVPLVIRAVIGRSWGQGAQHSQGLHSLFMHIPGLRVAAPSTPFDAKGLLIQSIRDSNPVLFVEHRLLHSVRGPVPEKNYAVDFGKARILREGTDVTLVGISWMAQECLRAAEALAAQGIQTEVIDPVSLSPLDVDTILKSSEKTGRLLVVDSSWIFCGASAEIAAAFAERAIKTVHVRRMGYAPVNCPPSQPLERHFYPDAGKITEAVCEMLGSENVGSDPSTVSVPRSL